MSALRGNADIIQGSQMPAFPPKTSLDYLIRPTLPFCLYRLLAVIDNSAHPNRPCDGL